MANSLVTLDQQSSIMAIAHRVKQERTSRDDLNPSALVTALLKLREEPIYADKKALQIIEAKLDALEKAAEQIFTGETLETYLDLVDDVRREKSKEANVSLATQFGKGSANFGKELGGGIFTDLLGKDMGRAINKRIGLTPESPNAERERANDIEKFKREVGAQVTGKGEPQTKGSGGVFDEESKIYIELIADQTGSSAQTLEQIRDTIKQNNGSIDGLTPQRVNEDDSVYIELIADQTGFAAKYLEQIRDSMGADKPADQADSQEENDREKRVVEERRAADHIKRMDMVITELRLANQKLDKLEKAYKDGGGGGSGGGMMDTLADLAMMRMGMGGLGKTVGKAGGAIAKGGSSLLSKLATPKGGGVLAAGAAAIGYGMDAKAEYDATGSVSGETIGKGVGGTAGAGLGAWGGGAAGAAIGSMILPGVGTVIGGLIGAGIGAWGGQAAGEAAGGAVANAIGKAPEISKGPAADMATALIMKEEGVAEKAYKDAHGYSVGVGHFIKENEIKQGFIDLGDERVPVKGPGGSQTVMTKAQAAKLLKMDLPKYTEAAAKPLGGAWSKLEPGQQAALISYAYNTGSTVSLVKKGLKDAIEKGDMQAAAQIIANGVQTSQGKPMAALSRRRSTEAAMFAANAKGGGGATPVQAPSPAGAQPSPTSAMDTAVASNTPKSSGSSSVPSVGASAATPAASKGSSAPAVAAVGAATVATAAASRPAAAPTQAPIVVAQESGGGGGGGSMPSGSSVADPKSKNDTLQRSFDRDFAYAV